MFPNSEENADRSGNCRAGTVIDTVVVHPYIQDYYLLSHGGLLGKGSRMDSVAGC